MTFTQGPSGLTFYSAANRSHQYETPTKVSCSYCQTPIMDEGRNMCLIFPSSIEYGEDYEKWRNAFEVDCHICYTTRVVDLPDGKPKWSGLDEHSNRLDDVGRGVSVRNNSSGYA
ncbi:hypothetical protein EYZ11_011291 [Aspergillus tanneri]|uniref:CENP-V/GFA domain-containing protein n=1 Tax=Aspergillus tanneri TaxID=1220188 RepID=A0A4S3J5B4_9EURO|nr:hypothetical protein EYZ11_011291 [Aspergillus tanneri]